MKFYRMTAYVAVPEKGEVGFQETHVWAKELHAKLEDKPTENYELLGSELTPMTAAEVQAKQSDLFNYWH